MRHLFRISVLALGAVLAVGQAQAATLYSNEASFVAATASTRLNLPVSDSGNFAVNGFAFTASVSPPSTFVIYSPDYGVAIPGETNAVNLLLSGTESFSVSSPSPLYAFGFSIYRPLNTAAVPGDPRGPVTCNYVCSTDPFTVELYNGSALVDSFAFTPVGNTAEFHGYSGASAFDTVKVIEGGANPYNAGNEYFATFDYGTSAAPEPASWALMILGAGGMGACLRTRRRKASATV